MFTHLDLSARTRARMHFAKHNPQPPVHTHINCVAVRSGCDQKLVCTTECTTTTNAHKVIESWNDGAIFDVFFSFMFFYSASSVFVYFCIIIFENLPVIEWCLPPAAAAAVHKTPSVYGDNTETKTNSVCTNPFKICVLFVFVVAALADILRLLFIADEANWHSEHRQCKSKVVR